MLVDVDVICECFVGYVEVVYCVVEEGLLGNGYWWFLGGKYMWCVY